ncbi:MAG: ribbon-helix-helix domain-containing protein [archaeon]|jgi:Arc/MetJ-type ribon-helix-helix transcriptional regulator
MVHISVRLGEEITNQIEGAIEEFRYRTKSQFVKEAIRHRLKELKLDRKKEAAWHKLLSKHKPKDTIKRTWSTGKTVIRKIRGPKFNLKDLLRYKHEMEYE